MFFNSTKKLALFLAAVLIVLFSVVSAVYAATPQTINYQGKLLNASSSPVTDGAYSMTFRLYDVASGGTHLWTETQSVSVQSGLFSVLLGSSTSLSAVDFNQQLYLGINIAGDGEMTPRKSLSSVPSAFEAENSQTIGGISSTSLLRSDQADTATGLLTFTGGIVSNSSSTITSLTTLTATTTTLVINNEAFTDFTGTALTNSSGVLSVDTSVLDLRYASSTDFDTEGELETLLSDVADVFTNNDTIGVANGGTGATTLTGLLIGNGTGAFTATTTLSTSYIADAYLRNTGDSISGNLTFSGSAANIALGSNFLSGDGDDEGVYVDNSGNVGIGTTSPSTKLSLGKPGASPISLAVYDGGVGDMYGIGTVSGGLSFGASIGTGDDPQMVLKTSGNVGIGTTTPQAKLHISGGNILLDNNQLIGFLDSTGTARTAMQWTSADLLQLINNGTGSGGDIAFMTKSGALESMRIDSSGNVGIGDSSPNAQLHIYGAGQTTANLTDAGNTGGMLRLSDSGSVAGAGGGISFANIQGDSAGSVGFAAIKGLLTDGGNNTAGDLAFSTRAVSTDTSLTERMIIKASGNVGIGTTSPSNVLHIWRNSGNTRITLENTSSGSSGLDLLSSIYSSISSPDASLGLVVGGSEKMRITTAGNVGIGDTSPASLFTVGSGDLFQVNSSGAIAAATGITSSGTINLSGLTASRLVATDASKNLTSTITAANLVSSVTSGTLWYSGNDGSGSGLDADTLDGISSASFVRGDGTDNGGVTIVADDSDFILKDTTDSQTNYLWRDWDASKLYLGTADAVATLRSNLVLNGNYISGDGGDEGIYIDASGNVGIGDTTPLSELSLGTNYTATFRGTGTVRSNGDLVLGADYDNNNSLSSSIIFQNNGSESMVIFDDGNVGIGDTSPSALLNVGSGNVAQVDGVNDLYVTDDIEAGGGIYANWPTDWVSTTSRRYISFGGPTGWGMAVGDIPDGSYHTDGLIFRTADARQFSFENASGNIAVEIGSNGGMNVVTGNVGIGTTSPAYPLHVYDEGTTTFLAIAGDGNNNARLLFNDGSDIVWNLGHVDSGGDFTLYDDNSSATRLVVEQGTGNIGVGDTSPSALLNVGSGNVAQVDGVNDLYVTDDLEVVGDVFAGAGAFQITSGGQIFQDSSNATFDVWIQGTDSASGGDARNLALLGNATNDDLILNYNTEYDCVSVGGTSCSYGLDVSGTGRFTGNLDADAGLDVTGNITVTGTVDGKDIATNAAMLNEAETISANWVNTANPWDISSETNLAAGTNITLSGDTLNVDDAFVLNTGDEMSGVLTINNNSTNSLTLNRSNTTSYSGLEYSESGVTRWLQYGTNDAAHDLVWQSRDATGAVIGSVLVLRNATRGVEITRNLDVGEGVDVTGNITVTGTVDGKDIATNAAMLNEAETISANWVNTANPWDISSETNLAAGTNITLSGDTLNVDDAFLQNNGDTGNGNYTLNGTADNIGLKVIKAIDSPDEPAALLVASDADGTDDLAIEVRGNATGSSVDTSTTLTSADTTFAIFADGTTAIGYNNLGLTYNNPNSAMFAVNGTGYFAGNLDAASGLDVTGNITVTGTVDGKDIATNAAMLNEAETISANWVNTANPWADNEVSDTITVGASGSVNSTALTDGGTISFDWTNAEVADALTVSGGTLGSNNVSGTWTTTGGLTIGDGGDIVTLSASRIDMLVYGGSHIGYGANYDNYFTYGSGGSTFFRTYNGSAYDNRVVLSNTGDMTIDGELIAYGSNQIRMVGGNYGAFFRNDGSNTYLLLTASGDQLGTWNSLRPFSVNNSSGAVSMANGLYVTGGSLSVTNAITAATLDTGQGANELYDMNQNVLTSSNVTFGDIYASGGNVKVNSGDAYNKYCMWGSGDTTYCIGMYSGMTYGGLNDYAMTFTMNDDSDRGFLWRDTGDAVSDGAMSLTTTGVLTVKSTVTAATFNSGSGNMELGDAAVANGDTNSIPTGDQVYDFVIGLGYITNDTSVAKNHLINSGTLSFDWANSEVADNLTINESGAVDPDALNCDVTNDNLVGEDCIGDVLDASEIEDIYLFNTGDTMSGSLVSTSYIEAGNGSGGVAMTINDGYGNANLTFNHRAGVPDQSGSSARIESAVDGTTASLSFELGNSVTGSVATALTQVLFMNTTAADFDVNLDANYGLDVTGNITVGGTALVGIGTTNPLADLHVYDSDSGATPNGVANDFFIESSTNAGLTIGSGNAYAGNIYFADNGDNNPGGVKYDHGSAVLTLRSNDIDQMMLSSGYVQFANTYASVGSSNVCWDGSGTSLWGGCTSLQKYKDNIVDLSLGLETLLALRPVEFDWNEKIGAEGHDFGFIAEEVEAINPLMAEYGGASGALSGVRYTQLTSLLTASIQDIATIIDLTSASTTQTAITINADGKLALGTTTATAQLTTDGSVRFANFGAGTLQTDALGNLMVSSDERLKNIAGTFNSGLDAILAIEPISYSWKEETGFDSAGTYVGFSAQNVELALPDAVSYDKNGYRTLSDRTILATVVNAMKELWEKVNNNSSEIETLKARIEALETQLGESGGIDSSNNDGTGTTGSTGNTSSDTATDPNQDTSDGDDTDISTDNTNNGSDSSTATDETASDATNESTTVDNTGTTGNETAADTDVGNEASDSSSSNTTVTDDSLDTADSSNNDSESDSTGDEEGSVTNDTASTGGSDTGVDDISDTNSTNSGNDAGDTGTSNEDAGTSTPDSADTSETTDS